MSKNSQLSESASGGLETQSSKQQSDSEKTEREDLLKRLEDIIEKIRGGKLKLEDVRKVLEILGREVFAKQEADQKAQAANKNHEFLENFDFQAFLENEKLVSLITKYLDRDRRNKDSERDGFVDYVVVKGIGENETFLERKWVSGRKEDKEDYQSQRNRNLSNRGSPIVDRIPNQENPDTRNASLKREWHSFLKGFKEKICKIFMGGNYPYSKSQDDQVFEFIKRLKELDVVAGFSALRDLVEGELGKVEDVVELKTPVLGSDKTVWVHDYKKIDRYRNDDYHARTLEQKRLEREYSGLEEDPIDHKYYYAQALKQEPLEQEYSGLKEEIIASAARKRYCEIDPGYLKRIRKKLLEIGVPSFPFQPLGEGNEFFAKELLKVIIFAINDEIKICDKKDLNLDLSITKEIVSQALLGAIKELIEGCGSSGQIHLNVSAEKFIPRFLKSIEKTATMVVNQDFDAFLDSRLEKEVESGVRSEEALVGKGQPGESPESAQGGLIDRGGSGKVPAAEYSQSK